MKATPTRPLSHPCAFEDIATLAGGSKHVSKAFHENFDQCCCSDEFKFVTKPKPGVTIFKMEYCEASKLLEHVLSNSPFLASRFVASLETHPNDFEHQWSCILGFDEFNPGDKLSSFLAGKKVMCLYFTFAELSSASVGDTWFCLLATRQCVIDHLEGGWSRVFATVLHRMFLGTHGLSRVGANFSFKSKSYILFAKLSNILSDGAGLQKAIGWRGWSSLRVALVHDNILKKGSDLANRVAGFVEASCSNYDLLHKTTTTEFERRCDFVAEAHARFVNGSLGTTMYTNFLKSESQNFIEGGLAFDRRLRELDWWSTVTVDWVHTFLQDGVFSTEALLMIKAMELPGETMKQFLQQEWEFPKALQTKGKQLWRVFSEHRLDDNGDVDKIRCSASELLGLFGLLRYFFEIKMRTHPALIANWQSFEACCDVLAFILAVKNGEYQLREASPILKGKITRFMRLHVACYGDEYVKPKHPWMWAIVEHWLRDASVYDAFVVERLHLLVKTTATRVDNTRAFERSVLSGTLNTMMASLKHLRGPCMFEGRTRILPSLPSTIFAESMVIWAAKFTVGDMVLHQNAAGELRACALEGGIYYGVVEMFAHMQSITRFGHKWRSVGNIKLIPARDLTLAIMGASGINFIGLGRRYGLGGWVRGSEDFLFPNGDPRQLRGCM
jgi:hypothetical protein